MPTVTTLKGQNFRTFMWDETGQKWYAIAMATNCTITLTNNTQDAAHKDIAGLANLPTVVSKSWQVSVESFDMSDVGSLLSAMKNKTKLKVAWGESSVSDTTVFTPSANYSRQGFAYLSDCTFTFNDRENSTKNIQFTGASELQAVVGGDEPGMISADSYTKGQNVRLFVSSDNNTAPTSVIAAAKSLSFHCSLQMESATTKDTTGNYDIQEPTALSYDISTNALVRSADTIESQVGGNSLSDIAAIYEDGTPVKWKIANTSGANNRTAGSTIVSGSAIVTQLTINSAVKNNVTYDSQFTGYGEYNVGS